MISFIEIILRSNCHLMIVFADVKLVMVASLTLTLKIA